MRVMSREGTASLNLRYALQLGATTKHSAASKFAERDKADLGGCLLTLHSGQKADRQREVGVGSASGSGVGLVGEKLWKRATRKRSTGQAIHYSFSLSWMHKKRTWVGRAPEE